MLEVKLHPGLPNGRFACLRSLNGADEASISDGGDLAATALVDRLLVSVPGTSVGPGSIWELSVSDRDRLLASLFRLHFGEAVEGHVRCRHCSEEFEFTHTVSALLDYLTPESLQLSSGPDDDGVFETEGGRFRLPTLGDQRSIQGLDVDAAARELLSRCVFDEIEEDDVDNVEAAMAEAGPVLDFDMDAHCPECDGAHTIHFDIREHLFSALVGDRPWLIREVHSIARAYGWSREAIMELSREDRRAHAGLIEAERVAAARVGR